MIRTPDQRVRVFVSSTMRELAAERLAVTAAIAQLRLTPVLFEVGARPYPPRDLTDRFAGQPAAPAAPAAPLPVPRWALVDRVEELQVVTGLLLEPETGLVTLTGPGGVGKTALALAAAHAVADEFAEAAGGDHPALRNAGHDPRVCAGAAGRERRGGRDAPSPRRVRPGPGRARRAAAAGTRRTIPLDDAARSLHGSALQLWGRGELAQAAARKEPAVEIFRSAGEDRWLSYGLALMARVRTGQERPAEARALLEEARAVWSRVTATYGQPFDAYLRYYLGSVALVQGDGKTAGAHLTASLRELEAAGDDMARGVVLGSLGLLSAQGGGHAQARARFAEGLPLLRQGGDQWDLAMLLLNSGLEEARAASPTAGPLLIEALQAWQRLGRAVGIAFALAGLGEVAAASGAPRRAGQLFGASQALLPATDHVLRVVVPYDLPAKMVAARAGGDPVAFDRGLAEGQAWTIDEAVAAGLASPANPDTEPE
jgi:tetratricopeptide (TPR) repeat protein